MNETARRHVREAESLFMRLHRARKAAVTGRGLDLTEYRETLVAEEEPVVEAIQRRGFALLGIGAGRVVFSIPNSECVVKVARYGDEPADDGRWQNRNEMETWQAAADDLNLAPVHDAGEVYSYVVMPEYEPLTEVLSDDPEQRSQMVDALQNHLFNADVFVKLLDVREENIGVDGDTVVLMDYGLSGDHEYDE